ncbi:hypothetical protein [Gemmobacter aquaticus]|uniref:hypothetical protein n=1 Tax=Gemmobacter aquaticus TaxID=490185 RepID=UPI0011B56AE1|nr:hypothetical protein [Gemmobacter aquaticus]
MQRPGLDPGRSRISWDIGDVRASATPVDVGGFDVQRPGANRIENLCTSSHDRIEDFNLGSFQLLGTARH